MQIVVLVRFGLPSTHDGYFHVGWIEALNHALYSEGVYARWYADAFGGVGSPSFVFYPPLFRILSLPFGWVIDSGSGLARAAIATVLVLNAAAAWTALRSLTRNPMARASGMLLAVLNPYLMVCVWVRGAWPEALAIAMVWWLMAGVWTLLRGELRGGFAIASLALAGLFLSHHPTALLVLYGGVAIAGILALRGSWRVLGALALALVSGVALSAFHLWPALVDQDAIQLLTGNSISRSNWPQWLADSAPFARELAWIWVWLVLIVLTAWATGGIRRWRDARAWTCVLVSSLAVLAMTYVAAAAYVWLPMLGMIQFPWRWMALATPVAIGLVAILGSDPSRRGRVVAALLALGGVATAAPALRDVRWESAAQATLDEIYLCGRQARDCSQFDAPEPLRDRFGELRYLGQLDRHHGPWLDADGGIWRTDVYDYMPLKLHLMSWGRSDAGQRFMPPFPARAEARIEPPGAARILGERRATHRWVLDVDVAEAAELTLERLRFPGWEVLVGSEDAGYRRVEPDPDSLYYRVLLEPGRHRVKLRQVGTLAERAGEWVSLVGWIGWFAWLRRSRRRASWPPSTKETIA